MARIGDLVKDPFGEPTPSERTASPDPISYRSLRLQREAPASGTEPAPAHIEQERRSTAQERKTGMVPTMEWKEGVVRLLDQSRLPGEIVYLDCRTYWEVGLAIRNLKVRGAPAIGVAAAMGVALGAQSLTTTDWREFAKGVDAICSRLAETRPTAVNLFWALERMKRLLGMLQGQPVGDMKQELIGEARRILQEDIVLNQTIGRHGAALVRDGQTILTHCNAGALATAGFGTALGVIRTAWTEGKKISVLAGETRPVLQGARLTVWELMQDAIPVTLITDNMAGALMRQRKVDLCIVGADRIAANGDVANKIGTYSLAVLAKEHGIPFYVAAPFSTVDLKTETGDAIPIEERPASEVLSLNGGPPIAPAGVPVLNPAFDITPARYVTGIITERGVLKPHEVAQPRPS
jgi:methylthioribose-1-phosphate isomerase